MGATVTVFPNPLLQLNQSGVTQWVPLVGAYSDIIDLTTTGTYVIVQPTPNRIRIIQSAWEIKTTGGTISTNPTYSGGSNDASYDNYYASQTTTGFTTGAAETIIAPAAISPNPYVDLTTSGFKVKVTVAATGSSPVLTVRFFLYGLLLPA